MTQTFINRMGLERMQVYSGFCRYFWMAAFLVGSTAGGSPIANGADQNAHFDGEKTAWHDGFDRYDLLMDDETLVVKPFKRDGDERFGVKPPPTGQRRCIVVVPKVPAAGNPWSWRGCYWDHEPQTEVELLRRGFHVAFITPDPGKTWDAWYAYLTNKHGLSRIPAFIGMSKGGVNEYDWTTVNPDKVSCIYADNPAIRPEALAKLGELARNDVPLLNICGSLDFLLERHTLVIEKRYHELGGRITVMIKEGAAHHPHSLRNPRPIADWIEANVRTPDSGRFAFEDKSFRRSYYYNVESTYRPLKEEKTYAICRGPGFAECYERYDATTKSPWGVTGMAVVVPRIAAPGNCGCSGQTRSDPNPPSIRPCSPRAIISSWRLWSRKPARCGTSGTPFTRFSPITDSPAKP